MQVFFQLLIIFMFYYCFLCVSGASGTRYETGTDSWAGLLVPAIAHVANNKHSENLQKNARLNPSEQQ